MTDDRLNGIVTDSFAAIHDLTDTYGSGYFNDREQSVVWVVKIGKSRFRDFALACYDVGERGRVQYVNTGPPRATVVGDTRWEGMTSCHL